MYLTVGPEKVLYLVEPTFTGAMLILKHSKRIVRKRLILLWNTVSIAMAL